MKIACAYNAFYIEKAHANFITIKKQINSDEKPYFCNPNKKRLLQCMWLACIRVLQIDV